MAIIIGLTGGIATGKSTVSAMFKKIGIPVIDADVIGKKVVEIDKPAYHKIIETFGEDITLCTGHINRKKLASLVFGDSEKRKQLNDIIHPEVKALIKKEIKKFIVLGEEYIVIDVALLFESRYSFDEICDLTVVVFTDEDTQMNRLIKRDKISEEKARMRIDAQLDIREKLQLADYKIDNSLSILETRKQFDAFMNKINKNKFLYSK